MRKAIAPARGKKCRFKSEIRNPKSERSPKSEIRSTNVLRGVFSNFGFRISFGFRYSDFRFRSHAFFDYRMVHGGITDTRVGRIPDVRIGYVCDQRHTCIRYRILIEICTSRESEPGSIMNTTQPVRSDVRFCRKSSAFTLISLMRPRSTDFEN
jgi:hypothetical protein